MDTPFSIHLGLFFLLWSSEQQKTHKHKGDESMNIPTKIGSDLQNAFREEDENIKVYERRRTPIDGNTPHDSLGQVS